VFVKPAAHGGIRFTAEGVRLHSSHMDDAQVRCPYCSEVVVLEVDPEDRGAMIEDCQVCCRPWEVYIGEDVEGMASVMVRRAN